MILLLRLWLSATLIFIFVYELAGDQHPGLWGFVMLVCVAQLYIFPVAWYIHVRWVAASDVRVILIIDLCVMNLAYVPWKTLIGYDFIEVAYKWLSLAILHVRASWNTDKFVESVLTSSSILMSGVLCWLPKYLCMLLTLTAWSNLTIFAGLVLISAN